MIVHLVCLKFRDPGDAEGIAGRLEELPGKIPVIRRLEVGRDVVRSERSYDLALIVEVDSLDDLDTYRKHPAHVEVGALIAAAADQVAFLDYER